MEKEMGKEKNIYIIKNGMEKDMIQMVKLFMN